MKINENILSLPPYISTAWHYISAIVMKGSNLVITLKDGDSIHIPGLDPETIDLIFKTHAEQIEKKCSSELFLTSKSLEDHQQLSSIKFGFATFDGLNTMMQHNPQEMNAPDLPGVILEKIAAIAKILAPQETDSLPQDIPNCNCFHCQITRAIHQNKEEYRETDIIAEEIISDKDLQFNQWDVRSIGEKLFNVINKLDNSEQYHVFLGTPIGCNCGKINCEHIVAALRA